MNFSDWLKAENGRYRALSERFGVTVQAISQWRHNGVPRDKIIAMRDFTGGEVTLEEMLQPTAEAEVADGEGGTA